MANSTGNTKSIKRVLLKFLLLLMIIANFPFFSSFGMKTLDEEDGYVDSSSTISLQIMPKDIIRTIADHLDPLSILKLSHASKRFREVLNDHFWVKYNFRHNYQTFDEEVSYLWVFSYTQKASPIKVMLANYYYEIGLEVFYRQGDWKTLMKTAAVLGLEKAQSEKKCGRCRKGIPSVSDFCPCCAKLAWEGYKACIRCHTSIPYHTDYCFPCQAEKREDQQFVYEQMRSGNQRVNWDTYMEQRGW